jgi:rubrerythrin
LLITKNVKIRWKSNNKKWYEGNGYIFTKMGDDFQVKIDDLSRGTNTLVDIQCDGCKEILTEVLWTNYKKCVHGDGKYYCKKCANNNNRKYTSFYDWCYENLIKEEADHIMARWDYEKNVDKNGKVISPKYITYSSQGFNRKGYWFKCLDHSEHKSELKNINNFVRNKGHINCIQCTKIIITYPYLIKYLANEEDASKYSHGSSKKIPMKCPNCGHKKEMAISSVIRSGFACPVCSDGKSYPEKFLSSIFDQLEIKFKSQLTKAIFKWCGGYRYDFYIPLIHCIIETHGEQHYIEKVGKWASLNETQENDKLKKQLARQNGIKNYITIDCRESNIEWIKKSIMNRKPENPNQPCLAEILNFKEEDIDWLKCHEYACSSLVKTVCDMWNNGIKSTLELSKQLKLNRTTIIRYLEKGIQWCDYNPKKEMQDSSKISKSVICITTGEIFKSIADAGRKYNINQCGIGECCRDKYKIIGRKSAGKHPITGEPLQWMYYEEYIKQTNTEEI